MAKLSMRSVFRSCYHFARAVQHFRILRLLDRSHISKQPGSMHPYAFYSNQSCLTPSTPFRRHWPPFLSLTLAPHDHPDFAQSQGSFLYPSHPSHTSMLQPIPNLHSHTLTQFSSSLPTDIRPPPNPHSSFPSTPHPNPCYIPAPKKKTSP